MEECTNDDHATHEALGALVEFLLQADNFQLQGGDLDVSHLEVDVRLTQPVAVVGILALGCKYAHDPEQQRQVETHGSKREPMRGNLRAFDLLRKARAYRSVLGEHSCLAKTNRHTH